MASLYDKPVRALMHDMVRDIDLKPDTPISRHSVRSWFKEKYPKIKDGTIEARLLRMSVNSKSWVHYGAKPGEDDLQKIGTDLFSYRIEKNRTTVENRGARSTTR